ncbi:unnamed protein product [Peronospora farinosa]|uniref:Zinc finger PHD-type domain-containing protein n=1 Tax=Peronospora farinosa TaxID=134698 RepID=A0AAV0UB82_9STRA|nr:unnamed protein product [Peronospora farinosa]
MTAASIAAHTKSDLSSLDSGIAADQVSHWEDVQKTDETLPDVQNAAVIQPHKEEETVSLVTSGTSLILDGGSSDSVALITDGGTIHRDKTGTSLRAVVHTVIADPTNEEASPLSHAANVTALDLGFSAPIKKESFQQKEVAQVALITRPSRAAAVAATVGMAREAKQEINSLELLIESAFELENRDADMEIYHVTKKRTIDGHGRALKRSEEAVTKVLQNTLRTESAEQNLTYGKKQRQAATYKAGFVEPSPIITDIPPLPFTSTSPVLRIKGKNKLKSKRYVKTKTESLHSLKEMNGCDDRHCEYCKKAANICVLMHCHACRRVYHAQCFLHAFKPYVDESMPIFGQIEHLQLKASEHRGSIFRCASCKAAFLDFYESGGYLWDCDCPTCSQPEKTVFYRQKKLVQMMNGMELEKQRKKEQKSQRKNGSFNASWKPHVSTSSWSNSISRSRRTRVSDVIDR